MKQLLSVLALLFLAAFAFGQQPAPYTVYGRWSMTTQTAVTSTSSRQG